MLKGQKSVLGHQIEDMLIGCEFSGKPELHTESCLKYFVPLYDPHLGNCFTFASGNGERQKLLVTEPDAWQDVKDMDLVLNVEHDEYLSPGKTTPGLIISVHEDMSYPHIFAHGMHVYADHSYNLAVTKNSVYLLPKPYMTNCTNYDDLPFHSLSSMELTPRICTVECLLYLQRTGCDHHYVTDNVVLFSQDIPYDYHQITEEDKQCAMSLSKNYKEYCTSLCSVPCHDTHYSINIDSSPTSEHKIVVNEKDLENYKKKRGEEKGIFVADVRIHYQTMEHRIYRHSPEFNTETLFSYLGGITGGWLGISLLEFCAFIEGLCTVLIFTLRPCKPKKRDKKRRKAKSPVKSFSKHKCSCGRAINSDIMFGFPIARSGRIVQVVPYGYY
ncbi:amiloride-sensitive sodium channel subunit beta-2-like [Uloborus diversus]|uniref:amiloride-sensitive sodium channel subunit beta-2-like n=1 Tax=Uloborus diversus TaxID=327109 RepID=UPI002409ED01|nr:amiloride-sensitive sodium channel subunit beta-2-like [Uloborus diversus]